MYSHSQLNIIKDIENLEYIKISTRVIILWEPGKKPTSLPQGTWYKKKIAKHTTVGLLLVGEGKKTKRSKKAKKQKSVHKETPPKNKRRKEVKEEIVTKNKKSEKGTKEEQ